MAQPLPYNREHNFLLDEEGSVNSQALNAEFDGASLSINRLRENLAKLQNDDGTLRTGVVRIDALASDVVKDVADATERAAQAAAITLDQALSTSQKIAQIDEAVTSNANSVALMKSSVDASEQAVTTLAAQVVEFSDELVIVSDNVETIRVVGTQRDAIQAIANDIQGFPVYEFDGGEIDEPNESMNGVGGVIRICADNIEYIRQVASSLGGTNIAQLANVVEEIGSTDYVQIDQTGNTGV